MPLSLVSSPEQSHINLTFHGVGPQTRPLEPGEDGVWVTSELFTSVLDVVEGRPDVTITFDDGNDSDVRVALPALRERGLTATFFVVAGKLGSPGFLSAEDVRLLAGEGMTIGNHGMHHRSWRKLDDDTLKEELGSARGMLEEVVGGRVAQAAIPFGSYDRRVLQALRRHGYDRAFTSDGGPAQPGRWLQARTSLRKVDGVAQVRQILWPTASAWSTATRGAKAAVKRWR